MSAVPASAVDDEHRAGAGRDGAEDLDKMLVQGLALQWSLHGRDFAIEGTD